MSGGTETCSLGPDRLLSGRRPSHTDVTDELTRRAVLAGAAASGTAALAPTASARVTRRMIVPEASDFVSEGGYAGLFVHVGEETSPTTDPADVDECGFESWSPTELAAYDSQLVDRKDQSHRQTATTVHVASDADVSSGSLWVVNRRIDCSGDVVGLEVEQVGAAIEVSTATATGGAIAGGDGDVATSTEGSGAGFGPLAGAAGLLAAGAALIRRRSSDD